MTPAALLAATGYNPAAPPTNESGAAMQRAKLQPVTSGRCPRYDRAHALEALAPYL